MRADIHKQTAKLFLEETGYAVEPIPEARAGDAMRADLFASSQTDALIVEVKSRLDEEGLADQFLKAKPREHVGFQYSLKRNETISKEIEKSSRQIAATKVLHPSAFGVLWVRPQQRFGLRDTEQSLMATLFGMRHAHVTSPDGHAGWRKCYFCDYADLYRYRDIAAVVFNKDSDGLLIPNPFAPDAALFRSTLLYNDYKRAGAVFDPEDEVADGESLVLHRSVDLREPGSVVLALAEEYPGHRIVFADMFEIGGVVPIQ